MRTEPTNRPVSDKVIRERTFEILGDREDKKDMVGQVTITLQQLLCNGFVGQITLNCSNGRVNSVQVKETKRV